MARRVKRPISVWMAQILLVFFVLMMVLAFFVAMMANGASGPSFNGIRLLLAVDVVFLIVIGMAFMGMSTRKPYGRWVGVGFLSFMLVFANLSKMLFSSNPAEPIAAIVVRILYSVLLLAVILHLSLSDKVADFFDRKIEVVYPDPPPPPSFDS